MKRLSKIITVLLSISLMLVMFGVCASAESSEPADSAPELTLDDVKFIFKYTSDSVVSEGLTHRTYFDPISNQTGIELIPEFGMGYAIYDDPETEIIDGIRINGAEVTSLRIPVSPDTDVFEYEVAVRTVYVDGASGDLAQILDGTYDYSKLLTNPVVLLQAAYWAIMLITGFAGFIILICNKNKKVKTSDEIANKVSENAEEFKAKLIDVVTEVVKTEILPLAQASVKSGKEAVKAVLLHTSKSKDAPAALLDVFKESSDIDINSIVDEVRSELAKTFNANESKHAANAAALRNIANNVIQEDVKDATETNTEPAKTYKSVF